MPKTNAVKAKRLLGRLPSIDGGTLASICAPSLSQKRIDVHLSFNQVRFGFSEAVSSEFASN